MTHTHAHKHDYASSHAYSAKTQPVNHPHCDEAAHNPDVMHYHRHLHIKGKYQHHGKEVKR